MSEVSLHLGDCLEILPTLRRDAAIVSDPPYGMRYKSGPNSRNSISTTGKRFTATVHGDDSPFNPTPWLEFSAIRKIVLEDVLDIRPLIRIIVLD